MERRVVKALKPVLSRAAGVPMPEDSVFDAVERLHAELDDVRALLTGPDASVRLVLTPEAVVLAEARRSWTTLSLFGYRVDGVVANRVFPSEGADPWRAGWVRAQDAVLAEVAASFDGLPVWRSLYRAEEPVGVEALGALASDLYAGEDPFVAPSGDGPFRVSRVASGSVLHLALPLVTRAEVDLARNGDELVVTVGSYRRLLTLPAALARHRVAGARVEQGELQVQVRGDGHVNSGPREVPPEDPGEQVGSVSEEAAKLFGALSDWARDHGPDLGDAGDGLVEPGGGARPPPSRESTTTSTPAPRSVAGARCAGPSTWCARPAPRSATTWRPRRPP